MLFGKVHAVRIIDSLFVTEFDPLRFHGDQAAAGALLDFAVNVRSPRPPGWLREVLEKGLDTLGAYPNPEQARIDVAHHHGVRPEEVLLLAGAAEGFALLPRLQPRNATIIHPSFTEPEYALRAAGIPIQHWILPPPFTLEDTQGAAVCPAELGQMVVIGNPTNPTGVLHSRAQLLALAERTNTLVVDEAFMDLAPDESMIEYIDRRVIVLRSLTKTWGLAGLRCGYLVAAADTVAELERCRPHWPLGTLQLLAIQYTLAADIRPIREEMLQQRAHMVEFLRAHNWYIWPSQAPFLLVNPPGNNVEAQRIALAERGIAVRRCDTFPGLDTRFWRLAVRDAQAIATLEEWRKEIVQ